jgi:tetratricopeptide (TPR) repeat protein
MFTTSLKIRSDNAKDQFRLTYTKTLENGDTTEAKETLDKQLALRLITKAEYDDYVATMPGDVYIAQANRLMAQGNYNAALSALTQTEKMDLTTEQLKDKQTLTNYAKNQGDELTTQQVQAIHELAIKDAAPDIVKAKIDQSDGLTPMQKTEAWKQYNDAIAVRAKTGQNPYETTQDWNAAMEAYWKAEQGIAPDRNDVGSKYDVQWYEKLKKIAEGGGTTGDFEDSMAAKFLKELIDDFGRRYSLYQEVPVMREKAFRLLQDGIQSAKTPLTDREKKELALRIFNNLQSEPITSAPGALLTPTEKAEELGQSLDKAVAENIAYKKTKGRSTTIPQPQSQAEFDAIPSGSRYRRSDGSIWTKR